MARENSKIITKEQLIKKISKASGVGFETTKTMYNFFEDIVKENLAQADENNDIIVKLFEGINLECNYIPAKKKKNNLTGAIINVDSKIKPKAVITKSYCEKVNHFDRETA